MISVVLPLFEISLSADPVDLRPNSPSLCWRFQERGNSLSWFAWIREADMSSSNGSSSAGGEIADNHYKNFIQHQVSKFDTLAGVAIKYGVEVFSFFFNLYVVFPLNFCLEFYLGSFFIWFEMLSRLDKSA